jgi:hypothetical protein
MDGEVRIETDRVEVVKRNQCSVCMRGQSCKELGANWGGCEDEGIWFENVRLCEPCLYGLGMVSMVCRLFLS